MKQLPITTAEIWAIPVPARQTTNDYEIVRCQDNFKIRQLHYPSDVYMVIYQNYVSVNIGEYDCIILGTATADEIDFDAAPLFENAGGMLNNKYALHAAIKAAGYYFVNHYGNYSPYRSDVTPEVYDAAQSNVVDKLVIIKKV